MTPSKKDSSCVTVQLPPQRHVPLRPSPSPTPPAVRPSVPPMSHASSEAENFYFADLKLMEELEDAKRTCDEKEYTTEEMDAAWNELRTHSRVRGQHVLFHPNHLLSFIKEMRHEAITDQFRVLRGENDEWTVMKGTRHSALIKDGQEYYPVRAEVAERLGERALQYEDQPYATIDQVIANMEDLKLDSTVFA